MPRADAIQNSFNGGEISPICFGRTDFQKWKSSVAKLQRMIALIQGPATKMPGFLFCKQTKGAAQARLMPYVFTNGDAFVIEFGDLYCRFYTGRAPVLNASQALTAATKANPCVVTYSGADNYANGQEVYITGVAGMTQLNGRWFKVAGVNTGANTFQLHDLDGNNVNSTSYTTYTSGGTAATIYEVVSPYALADIDDVRFKDSGDVIYLAHPDYAPQKLVRSDANSWAFTEISFKDGPYLEINKTDNGTMLALSANVAGGSIAVVANQTTGINDGDVGFQSTDVGRLVRWQNVDNSWSWVTITQYVSTTKVYGTIGGTLPATTAISISGITKANPAVITTALAHGVSVGDTIYISGVQGMTQINNKFGVASAVTATTITLTSIDSSAYSTYTSGGHVLIEANRITGITKANPAVVTSAGHNFTAGQTVYIDGVIGMTEINGKFVTITKTTATTYTLALDTSSGYTTYTSGGAATLASLIWRLGEWSDTTGYPSVVFDFEDRIGWAASPEAPTTMNLSNTGDYENFAPTSDGGVVAAQNALQLVLNSDTQDPIRWVHSDQLGLLMGTRAGEWIILSDITGGSMSALSLPSARQSTEHGSATSIDPVRVGKALLMVQASRRKVREISYVFQYNSFLAPDITPLAEHVTETGIYDICYQQEPFSVVWMRRGDGRLVSLTYDKEQDVKAFSQHPLGGYSDAGKTAAPVVESICTIPSPDGTQNDLWASVKYYINGATRRYVMYLGDMTTDLADGADAYFVDTGVQGTNGSPSATVNGLAHLEGETVEALGDGIYYPGLTVASGSVTLPKTVTKYSVGHNIIAQLQTLPLDAGSATGTPQGKLKKVINTWSRLYQTVGLKIGKSFSASDLQSINFRDNDVALGAATPMFTGIKRLDHDSEYEYDKQICIQQDQPYPLTILALMPQTETQDAT